MKHSPTRIGRTVFIMGFLLAMCVIFFSPHLSVKGDGMEDIDINSSCLDCHDSPPTDQSHYTHYYESKGPNITSCKDCHSFDETTHQDGNVDFSDGNQLAGTSSCDNCHSPNGTYDGVEMAKNSWSNGVYNGSSLKSGKDEWCASCHDDEPAFSIAQDRDSVVVDNGDATFVGSWDSYSGYGAMGGFRYRDCRKVSCDGSATATWTANLSEDGYYKVYASWAAFGNDNAVDNAEYTIDYHQGSETVEKNQGTSRGRWSLLGTYYFTEGTASITLNDDIESTDEGYYLSADAVMFDDQGIYAPNVVGDDSDFGFYMTGHGRSGAINCLSCHNSSKDHIDHEHRTYDAAEDDEYDSDPLWATQFGEGINPYGDSYRLKKVNGKEPMVLPRNSYYDEDNHFRLCFDCHNQSELFGEKKDDVRNTNLWNTGSGVNSHFYHLYKIGGDRFDSDWDSGKINPDERRPDSIISCTACHNVHGSPTKVMIRHGELISRYNPVSTVTWTTPDNFTGGDYSVYARWVNTSTRATNAQYTINYDGGSDVVHKDQRYNGGEWILLGNYTFSDGASNSVVLDNKWADGGVVADAVGWDSDGNFSTNPEVIVDNIDATTEGGISYWRPHTSSQDYGSDYLYNLPRLEKMPALNFSYLVEPSEYDTATFTPHFPQTGDYDVYARWTSNEYRSTKAPFTIYYNGGSETVRVDQETNGDQWNYLGTYNFTNGTSGRVVISNEDSYESDYLPDETDWVIADAVSFNGTTNITVDNEQAQFEGNWKYSSSSGYNGTLHYIASTKKDHNNTLDESIGGICDYDYGATHTSGVCRDCHHGVSYLREPYLKPRVFMAEVEPSSADNDGEHEVKFTAFGYTRTTTMTDVNIDLSSLNGSVSQTMYDDGTHGDIKAGDNLYSYQTVVPTSVDTGLKTQTITATNGDGAGTGERTELMVANPGWIVMDNKKADFRGLWNTATNLDYYGTNYAYHSSGGTGNNKVTFTPTLDQSDDYDVYAWWTSKSNRATNAPYTINYSGGSETVRVDQSENGSRFVNLGTYNFDAQSTTEVIVDNQGAQFIGDWSVWNTNYAGGDSRYGEDLRFISSGGDGSNTATFTPNLTQSGKYHVYAWWWAKDNRATNAPYTIDYSGGSDTVRVDQREGGGGWTYLGTYSFEAGTNGSVTLSDDADGTWVIADAVKWKLAEQKQHVKLSDDADGTWVIADAILFEPHSKPMNDNTISSKNYEDYQDLVLDLGVDANYNATSIQLITGDSVTVNLDIGNDELDATTTLDYEFSGEGLKAEGKGLTPTDGVFEFNIEPFIDDSKNFQSTYNASLGYDVVTAGNYSLEVELFVDDEKVEEKTYTVTVIDPQYEVIVPHEVAKGDILEITVNSNRKDGYDEIYVSLNNEDDFCSQKVSTNDNGTAIAEFDTQNLNGTAEVYVRDTMGTHTTDGNFSKENIGEMYCDLDPSSSKAGTIGAEDDLLINRQVNFVGAGIPTSTTTGTPETEVTPTATENDVTPTATEDDATPTATENDVTPTATEVTPEVEGEIPGFEAIFAITGMLAVSYLLRRR